MDKRVLLEYLLGMARGVEDEFYKPELTLKEASYSINDQSEKDLPSHLPSGPEQMIGVLRDYFKDDVTFISLFLNYHFPDQYLFYRVSTLEDEMFQGFDFLSEIIPEFAFSFRRVGKTGFDRYIILNQALLKFSRKQWPKLKEPQGRLGGFLYEALGPLFLERSDSNQYWIMATRGENQFEELDSGGNVTWSGRKEMKDGDLVFMYRTSPRKAITDIYQVGGDPMFDPWGGWDGFWVDLQKVCKIMDISFAEMRNDPVLGQWGLVRQQFQGTMTEPVPHAVYNRLLEKIPTAIRQKHELEPEPIVEVGYSGKFVSEADFEEAIVEPLLKRWSFRYQRQYGCRFHLGSQPYEGRVDFYVQDARGPVTLVESKLRILGDRELRLAVDQAKSYALMLGLPSFIVAAPEGLWLYSLSRHKEKLEKKVSPAELQAHPDEVKDLILRLRD